MLYDQLNEEAIDLAKLGVYKVSELEAMDAENYYTYLRHELMAAKKTTKKTKKDGTDN